jgi:hypothetical protein
MGITPQPKLRSINILIFFFSFDKISNPLYYVNFFSKNQLEPKKKEKKRKRHAFLNET